MILMGFAHLFGHIQGMKSFYNPDPGAERRMVEAMHSYVVGEGSGARSIASLYLGFSLVFSLASMMIGLLVLAATRELASNPAGLKHLSVILVLSLAGLTAISAVYFIPPPTIFLVVALLAAAAAAIRAGQAG